MLYSAIGGGILKIYPIPGDENNTWVSQPETSRANFTATDSVFVRQSLPVYIQFLQEAKKTNEYAKADKILEGIKTFQKKYVESVIIIIPRRTPSFLRTVIALGFFLLFFLKMCYKLENVCKVGILLTFSRLL